MSSWIKACEIKTLNNGEMFDFDHDDKKILIMKMKIKFMQLIGYAHMHSLIFLPDS